MIHTPDKRKFFTDEKNYPKLIEFSRTFGAEISVVKVKEAEILDYNELAPIICDPSYEIEMPEYKLLQVKIHNKKLKSLTGRAKVLETANMVKSYIEAEFLMGSVVSFQALMKKFKKLNLKQPTISNHLSKVKKELVKKGHKIEKISPGKYKLI
jgi:hypothetical protein